MKSSKIDLARELIEKYIRIGIKNNKGFSKKYLAKVLYNENPDLFSNEEDARLNVRRALNCAGTETRFLKNEQLARSFALISDPVIELRNPEPFVFPSGYNNTLWIADLHSRFYDKKALETSIDYAIKHGCDSVCINGDFMDFYGDSKFDKNPLILSTFEQEQEWGQDILKLLQDTFGYVVLKKGNHDIRRELLIERLSIKMPELQGLTSYSDYLFYEGSNVQIVEDYQHIIYGKLNGIHGHEYQGGGGIHTAYNRLNKTFDNTISAHSHKSQSVIKSSINGEIFGSWTIGCLCNLSPRYTPKNEWTQGFAVTKREKSGDFEVHNKVILKGKLFSA